MALITFGPVVVDARGKLGDVVYSRNQWGAYVRMKGTVTQPGSAKQTTVWGNLTSAVAGWRALTNAQRARWQALSQQIEARQALFDGQPLDGYRAYLKVNLRRLQIGLALTSTPPKLDPPCVMDLTGATADNSAQSFLVQWTYSPAASSRRFNIWASGPVEQSVNFFKPSDYRWMKTFQPNTGSVNTSIATPWIAQYGAIPTGKKISILVYPLQLSILANPPARLDIVSQA